jgi:butyrate kinase
MTAYLGTNSFIEVCRMAEDGDKKASLIIDAAAYQVSKEIGAMATVLNGEVDTIILTGGMAHEDSFINTIITRVGFIADVAVYPGEDELKALAFNGFLALDGKIEIKEYK